MQYMLLIYNAEGQKLSPEEQGKLFQEYMAFTQGIVKAGKFKAGDPLEPTTTATTVRVRNGKDADHRRPLRRDQGATWRLLYRRGRRTWTRRSLLPPGFPGLAPDQSRCGRS